MRKTITLRLLPDVLNEFKYACLDNNTNMQQVLTILLSDWLENKKKVSK